MNLWIITIDGRSEGTWDNEYEVIQEALRLARKLTGRQVQVLTYRGAKANRVVFTCQFQTA